ncbi:MAG: histidine--tRNA ligase [Anaeroplasmataceae bacterium]|nr:histidine--tRNA ligase [Anaeroplasmataceae bacterium]
MISRPKGTYDVLPNEVKAWTKLESTIRKVCQIYNYQEIRTPIFESGSVFHRDVNDTSDMVNKETYDFKDRSNRDITLRPEGTAGVVRAFIENKLYATSKMNKLFYIGPMFRYERPQKGRNRQFSQFGVEALGSNDPLLDAEVIALGASLIKALGLKNVKVKINSIGDKESRDKYREACVKYFNAYKEDLCSDCLIRLEKNPLRILDCKVDRDKDFFKNAPKIKDYLNESSLKHFEAVLNALKEMKISYEIDDNLVRGLDYYSHTVFELEVDILEFGAQNVIGAGGRYDSLVRDMQGPDTPGVGMAFGMERLLLACEYGGKVLSTLDYLHVYFIVLGQEAKKAALAQMNICRLGGLFCDMDYLDRGLKAQFKAADEHRAMFTCILGENELKDFKINIKNNETDVQETISLYEVYPYVLNHLNNKSACTSCKEKEVKKDE